MARSSYYWFVFVLFLTSCVTPVSVPPPCPVQPPATPIPFPPMPAEMTVGIKQKSGGPNGGVVVVIDPGHGGDDYGTHSNTKPTYHEKHMNLSTAQMLRTYLKQMGYKTIMTRTDDTFVSLDKRAEIANKIQPTLFVSVHYNSAPSIEAEGVEVYFYSSDISKERVRESRMLAKAVLDKVIDSCEAKSRGIKHGNFAVIRQTTMPAILIEGGFMTNDVEMERIKDPSYLKKIAWGIAQGIQTYVDR